MPRLDQARPRAQPCGAGVERRADVNIGVILRWHMLGLRNAARASLADHAREVLVAASAGLLLVIYNIASVYSSLSRAAPAIRAVWPRVAEMGLGATMLAGICLGRCCRRWAERRAQAPWLAVLPWPGAARARAVRVAWLGLGGALLPWPALCGWGVSHAVQAPHEGFAIPALALCFSVSFAAGALPDTRAVVERHGAGRAPASRRAAWLWRLTERLDAFAPRHLGLWAQGDGGRSVSAWWVLSLLAAGGFAAGISLAQAWIWPSVITAAAGGNMVFLAGLRARPLQSAVLRASPVRFGAAWTGIARGPLALSMLWFSIASLPALAVSAAAWRPILGAAGIKLVLDALFCTSLAASGGSRQRALVLYTSCLGMVVYQGAEYGIPYGVLTAFAAACVSAMLWRRARRRFRFNG